MVGLQQIHWELCIILHRAQKHMVQLAVFARGEKMAAWSLILLFGIGLSPLKGTTQIS